MAKYEMIEAGTHEEGGKLFKQGDLVESKNRLDELFPTRFRKAGQQQAFVMGVDDEPEGGAPAPKFKTAPKEATPVKEEVSSLGDDLTEEFDGAAKKDLKVYKDGRVYRVADADDVNTALDDGDLTSKAKVEAFIDEYEG